MGSIERYQAGLHDNKRPIGSFMFLGCTGVGKSFCVQQFAQLTQDPDAFITIDCSEYSLDHEVAKLIGSPPGYVGHESGSILTRQIEAIRNPENGFILLLDEIEKAHPKFFDMWLQVMDAGILTDAKGKKLDFTKAMIFFTSNVGSGNYADRADIGFRSVRPNESSVQNQVTQELKKTFRPEFLNRLTAQVLFHPLTKEQQLKIFNNLIADLNGRLAPYYIRVKIGKRFHEQLFALGFSREYGARELKRVLVRQLEQPLAHALISREIPEDSVVTVDITKDGKLVIKRTGAYPILLEEAVHSS